jgi:hypothetical protein
LLKNEWAVSGAHQQLITGVSDNVETNQKNQFLHQLPVFIPTDNGRLLLFQIIIDIVWISKWKQTVNELPQLVLFRL